MTFVMSPAIMMSTTKPPSPSVAKVAGTALALPPLTMVTMSTAPLTLALSTTTPLDQARTWTCQSSLASFPMAGGLEEGVQGAAEQPLEAEPQQQVKLIMLLS